MKFTCPKCKTVSEIKFFRKAGAKGGKANTKAQNLARAKNARLGGWPKGRKRK